MGDYFAVEKRYLISHFMLCLDRGGSTGTKGRLGGNRPKTLNGCWPKNRDTMGRSSIGFISPKMHQNSPFWAQKSKNFLGGTALSPSPSSSSSPPIPYPHGASILAPTALDLGSFARPNHTSWIRPCVWTVSVTGGDPQSVPIIYDRIFYLQFCVLFWWLLLWSYDIGSRKCGH